MKTLTKIALTTLLMGTGLALAAQPQQQANDVNAAPAQTQSMGSMMNMMQNMMGMMHKMMGTMQKMRARNTMMAQRGSTMSHGNGMMGQTGMAGGHMANNRSPSSKASMAGTNCHRHAHRHMSRQNRMGGQQASTDSAGSNAG